MKARPRRVQYCTASLNLFPTNPSSSLPLLKMDLETKHKIELTVTQILNSVDIDSVTELDIRTMASNQLNLDLSDLPHKILVRQITESFLLSLSDDYKQSHDEEVIKNKIQVAVTEILRNGEVYSVTLDDVIVRAGEIVGFDVSVLPYSDFVRQAFIGFLKSNKASGGGGGVVVEQGEQDIKPVVVVSPVDKHSSEDSCRVICKLSNKREVAIRGSGQKTLVSIRDLLWKDGKQIPSPKSISLSSEQWSNFRKSIPAIEEAIRKVESGLRSVLGRKLADDRLDGSKLEIKQYGGPQGRPELIQEEGTRHKPELVATGKGDKVASTVPSKPRGLLPIEIIRFDGKNYQQWVAHMELYLNYLQVAYVLSDPCPSAAGVTDSELGQTLSALQKWTDDDHICRQNILNSLCDNLFGHYSKKPGTAKDLWEELKLVYLNEEHGAKVSLVKKYVEFQMVEEKSVFEQVEEFHRIADSVNASGMYIEERFHVNVILSKLPPSWKPYSIELMKENYLPVWMLMDRLKAEEDSRRKGNKGEAILPRPNRSVLHPAKKLGPQRIPMKKPGVPPANYELDREGKVKFCTICKKKGHVPEQCWFRKPGGNEVTNEIDNVRTADIAANANTDGAAL